MVTIFGCLESLWDRRLNRPIPVEKHAHTWKKIANFLTRLRLRPTGDRSVLAGPDRQIVSATRLKRVCGRTALPAGLRDRPATSKLFAWLAQTLNGDMFPPSLVKTTPAAHHLTRVAEFLAAVDPESGQLSFFPYQFEVIPIELISSIYEQFAHAEPWTDGKRTEALQNGVHYTRLSVVVSLILDEVMDGLSGRERCWI
ncbi:MAG: hypothetical protein JL55_37520 [Pseudomonas sp. BICA1-14]|mgnify:FL=1|jgi:hypothetical protein|nr:MAG: hypothetical protein JL55_37520 [[Pseudomonas] sp. BICA1-14]